MLGGRKANLLKGVYVIIPAHNNLAVLKDTLTSLYPSYCHVIVVDDGSSDGTKEWLMQNLKISCEIPHSHLQNCEKKSSICLRNVRSGLTIQCISKYG